MPNNPTAKQSITIVSACMTRDGLPTFAISEVEAAQDEIDNGIHFYLAEADLFNAGYEEPFVHFADGERPGFLLAAVRNFLGLPSGDESIHVLAEES